VVGHRVNKGPGFGGYIRLDGCQAVNLAPAVAKIF